jgi:hypothetical protein
MNAGSDAGFLFDTPTRQKIDLSGRWEYTIEGGASGNVSIPAAYDFSGRVTFTRNFEITGDQIDRFSFSLVMYGVNYSCDILLNGDFLISHAGGGTSFVQHIPDNILQPGTQNQIRVVVSNELDPRSTIPLRMQIWGARNYGGITRDVFLLATPKLAIRDLDVATDFVKSFDEAQLTVQGTFEGEFAQEQDTRTASPGFYAEVFEKISGIPVGRSEVVKLIRTEEGWGPAKARVSVNMPRLWSPETPELYVVKAFVVSGSGKDMVLIDERDLNHGFRLVEISGGDIRLNGRRLLLKGVIWNEDHPTWGSALPYEQMERDIVLIKNLGANAVRFAGRPPHPYMLNLCDRYGLLALVEIPVGFTPASILQDEYFTELAKTMLKEMITRDRTHVSILAWGLGEGFESSSDKARSFVDALATLARSLDTRPLYYASVLPGTDRCTDLVDIAAMTVYAKELDLFKEHIDRWKQEHPRQPVVVARFGTEVQEGNKNGYSDPLSYEAQARFYVQRFDVMKAKEYDGAFIWAFNDWRGDRPSLAVGAGNPWMHTMGLVSYAREKRTAYDAVRSVYRNEKFVALPSGSYSATAPIVYVLTGLVLLIGFVYLYNADRRFRESLSRSTLNAYNFFSDIRDQRVVSPVHSAVMGLTASVALAVVTSTILYHFRSDWVLDALLSYLLVTEGLKEWMIHVIVSPLQFILYFSVIFFAFFLLLCGAVFVGARLLKSRILPYHAYSITMWSLAPFLVLIPVGMILFRVLENNVYVLPSFILVAVLKIWVILRILKGVSIVSDVSRSKVYITGLSVWLLLVVAGYMYLDQTQSASEYLRFLYHVASSSI